MTDAPRPEAEEPEPLADEPPAPLYDPYLTAPPAPVRAGLSPLALSAALALLFGPVGSILAIFFGWYARREIAETGRRRAGYWLATVSMVLGVATTMAWGGVLSYLAWTLRYRVEPAGEEPVVAAGDPRSAPRVVRRAPASPDPTPLPAPGSIAPRNTTVRREGDVTVVDVGLSSASLRDELAKQRAEATAAGETMVVMTTGGACDPCRGVDAALGDPLMQRALGRVRLVRLDTAEFDVDLAELRVPHEAIPGFFLLAPDLTPRDGVDGGEWGEDVAANIAPVLGPFVRGTYEKRKQPWHALPPSGVSL